MDLKDATLMILTASAAHQDLAELAQPAYDQLTMDGKVDYRVLSGTIAEASGKRVRDLPIRIHHLIDTHA